MESKKVKLTDLKKSDKIILKHLIKDSHEPQQRIAEDIETTRQNVSQRIKKLRKKQIIKSFSVKLNNELIEEIQLKAFILFQEDLHSNIRIEDENKISEIPNVIKFCRIFGSKYNGIIELNLRDNNELKEILKIIQNLKGIKETEIILVQDIIKDNFDSLLIHLLK